MTCPFFSIVNDPYISARESNEDLQLASEWAYKWKISFHPGKNKQAQEIVSLKKKHVSASSTLI